MTLPKSFLDRFTVGSSIELRDGRHVPVDIYIDVHEAAARGIPTLLRGVDFKAEHICGPNFWVPLSAYMARLAGTCLHDIVERDLLPLDVAPARGATLRYRRR
jgi:hypothetical protein